MFDNDKPWFAAKVYGLGSGPPIAWQGWAMIALHVAVIIAIVVPLRAHHVAALVCALLLTVAPMPLYAARTRGGWQWRWGRED